MTALLGIVNITEDSFSDGGRFLETSAALFHARALAKDAEILDIGAAASNVDAKSVSPEEEIRRLAPVVAALKAEGISLSVDTFSTEVQRWALGQGVDYLNDIQGFADPELYPVLAGSNANLIVMHSVQGRGRATRDEVSPSEIFSRVASFFDARLNALSKAGVGKARLILDPGMGFFLGANPDASFEMLKRLPDLKALFGLPLLVSVSRKSFLRRLTGRDPRQAGAATLSAEIFAADQGADYIRTHDPAALKDAVKIWESLRNKA